MTGLTAKAARNLAMPALFRSADSRRVDTFSPSLLRRGAKPNCTRTTPTLGTDFRLRIFAEVEPADRIAEAVSLEFELSTWA